MNMECGIMHIRIFLLKVTNNERKILTHYEYADRIAEQIESVITQMHKQSKLWIHRNFNEPGFSLAFSFKFTYFCIVDIWTLKKGFFKRKQETIYSH